MVTEFGKPGVYASISCSFLWKQTLLQVEACTKWQGDRLWRAGQDEGGPWLAVHPDKADAEQSLYFSLARPALVFTLPATRISRWVPVSQVCPHSRNQTCMYMRGVLSSVALTLFQTPILWLVALGKARASWGLGDCRNSSRCLGLSLPELA